MLKTQETRQADVLEVISNLSSDEVFTPPKVVNEMLDLLPEEVWRDPSLRWLDPGTKTGVFLREVTRRLMVGLEDEISDEQERLQHILKEMVFGIAITELTALMARRTLYCSKDASSERSIVEMPTSEGNIWFERTKHVFGARGKCMECGASKDQIERGEDLENYAYGFIHADGRKKIEEVMEMKFDVIVGNPPYQLEDGGAGGSATPIYNLFVDQARHMNPRHLVMILPSRWMAGGKGLSDFRQSLLADGHVRKLVDFPNALEVFPGVEIQSGVCYLHWDRERPGPCQVTQRRGGERIGPTERTLDEYDIFVRDAQGVGILRKVLSKDEAPVAQIVSGRNAFGLTTNFKRYRVGKKGSGDLKLFLIEAQKRKERWVPRDALTKESELVDAWKILVPKAYNGGPNLPHRIIGPAFVAGPKSVCTDSYIAIGPFEDEEQARSFESYIATRCFRFLLSLRKISQDATRGTYLWVPQQAWDREWTDEELYEKYGITKKEQAYIEEMIKEIPSE